MSINSYVEKNRNLEDPEPVSIFSNICSVQIQPNLVLEIYSGRSGIATIAYGRGGFKEVFSERPWAVLLVHFQPPTI